jgi:predicted ferric reductase
MTWYVARAGGLTAFVLLTFAVAVGLLLSGRLHSQERWPRFALEEVHRFLGLLAGTFVVIHGAGLLLDTYVPTSLLELVMPGLDGYRPLPTALGVLSAELMVALAVTNRLRSRIGYRRWRRAHYLNFAVWLFALVHGITVGTDSGAPWAVWLYVSCASLVMLLTASRFAGRAPAHGR